jgi:hypothetical protein
MLGALFSPAAVSLLRFCYCSNVKQVETWHMISSALLRMSRSTHTPAIAAAVQFLDNRHFHLFCETLRPGYMPVCPNTARTSLLPAEYAHCVQQLHNRLQQERNLTVTADGWTDRIKRAILALLVVFADGSKALLRSLEHSADDHTGVCSMALALGTLIGADLEVW